MFGTQKAEIILLFDFHWESAAREVRLSLRCEGGTVAALFQLLFRTAIHVLVCMKVRLEKCDDESAWKEVKLDQAGIAGFLKRFL